MKRFTLAAVLAVLLLGSALPARAQWLVESSLTSAVYHGHSPADPEPVTLVQRVGALSLGRTWRWAERSYLQVSLPLELSSTTMSPPHESRALRGSCRWPQLSLQTAAPTIWGPRGLARIDLDLGGPHLGVDLGLEGTWDPLLTYATLSFAPEGPRLKTGVMFAANKRWALGVHLTYGGLAEANPASSLTYQAYYQSSQGTAAEVSYTYHLHAAQQRLGFKLLF